MRISACIIAKDEAAGIAACVASVRWCDEVVVVDSGSRDGTPDLARAAGEPAAAAFAIARHVHYLGRWIDHGGWFPEWRVRLFDRRRARWGGIDPHDRVVVEGPVARIAEGEIQHFTYRSIGEHLAQIDHLTTIAAAEKVARGHTASLVPMLCRPPWRFLRMYVLRRGFLDGRPGFVLAVLAAYYVFLKYAKVWEATGYGGRRSGGGRLSADGSVGGHARWPPLARYRRREGAGPGGRSAQRGGARRAARSGGSATP